MQEVISDKNKHFLYYTTSVAQQPLGDKYFLLMRGVVPVEIIMLKRGDFFTEGRIARVLLYVVDII
jgi:hypothetical protein